MAGGSGIDGKKGQSSDINPRTGKPYYHGPLVDDPNAYSNRIAQGKANQAQTDATIKEATERRAKGRAATLLTGGAGLMDGGNSGGLARRILLGS
jgi:hypothetical protein